MRKIEIDGGTVEYEPDMPMGALRRVMSATVTGDLGELIIGYTKFVKSWPFKGDPTDPESWDDLTRSQFNEVTGKVMADLADLGNV